MLKRELTYKPLAQETWDDFYKLFAKHKGVRGGCWCTFYLCYSNEYNKMTKDQRREYHKMLVDNGLADGIIVYENNVPVGWCQLGRPEVVKRFDRGRIYSKLNFSENEKADWRISCVFSDKHHRKQGIGKFALTSAIEYIKQKGGGIVEAFPFDFDDKTKAKFQHNGSVEIFKSLGFKKVARIGKNEVLMRLHI